ncbi:MAG: HAD family hydrolase [Rhodothermales bacterium]
MIDTVVFDLGGVLIDWNPRHMYRTLMEDEQEMEHFLATVCTGEWNAQQDAGRPFAEGVAMLSAQWPEYHALIEAFHLRWIEMIHGPISKTVDILRTLRDQGTPIYALTNWSSETFPLVQPRFDFLSWFIGVVVSGEEKLIKPDPAFYHVMLDRYNLNPENLVFIDDSPPNIVAAEGLGIKALHFTSPEKLKSELTEMGLLPA